MTVLAPSPRFRQTSLRRVAVSTVVGTTLEWYDFFLYATAAALIFSTQYFPNISGTAQTLASLSTITIGYIARPLGSVLFGHFGDRVGRKQLLVISLLLMGLATFAVGLLPNYNSIGVWAPVMLVVLRLLQGLAVGGEWGGALLMAVEHAPEEKRAFYGSLPQLGAPLGFIISTAVLLIPSLTLSEGSFNSWGWRVPFLFSFVLIGVGLYLRARVPESPEFEAAAESRRIARFPIFDLFRTSWRQLVLGAAMGVPGGLGYFMFTSFVFVYGTGLGVSRNSLLISVIIGNVAMMFVMPYAAVLSDRVGPRPLLFGSILGIALWAVPAVKLYDTGDSTLLTLGVVIGLMLVGVSLATLAPWYAEMYDVKLRYTGAGLTYMITGLLGSGVAALVTPSLLAASDGAGWSVALYLAAWSVLGLICLGVTVRALRPAAA